MERYDIINKLIETFGFESYLEIGTENKKSCFDKVNAKKKFCIDPEPEAEADFTGTSDDFFHQQDNHTIPSMKFDIIFIDGMHEDIQVRRDIENSLRYLNSNGVIVLHDCNPISEWAATPYKDLNLNSSRNMQFSWNGDVYKAFIYYKWINKADYRMFVVDADYGCGIILTSEKSDVEKIDEADFNMEILEYDKFDINRKELLELVSIEEFHKICSELQK